MRPAQAPAAFTTTSACSDPESVRTPATRSPLHSSPVTGRPGNTSTPSTCAAAAAVAV